MSLIKTFVPANRMRQRGITGAAGLLIMLNVFVFGMAVWKIWQANHPQPEPPVAETPAPIPNSVTATSAKGVFSITFPAGWDHVARVMNDDRFIIEGPQQPIARSDIQAVVNDVVGFEAGELAVFEAAVDDDFPSPDGDAVDFLAGEGKYLLSGRKYNYTYTGNSLNKMRKNGDKDYVYSFPLGGKRELRVTYSVFSDDPINNVKVIDNVVRSIHKLK
jgi:hypothetical protein